MHPPLRLVAVDIDGTLLPSTSQCISPRNAEALRAVQQAGITLVVATGRRTAFLTPLLEPIGLRADTPLITSNGAVTHTLHGEAIDSRCIEPRVARGLCTLLRPFGTMVITFNRPGARELVVESLEGAHPEIARWVNSNRDDMEFVQPLESVFDHGEQPIQGMVCGSLPRMRQAEEAISASPWAGLCEAERTEYPARDLSFLDLLPAGVCKGWALEQLAGRLGVDHKETMAIGDNWNDVGMLEWAGQPVLMGNAAWELRAMAKTNGWKQAPDNDHDGVAVVLEESLRRNAKARA
jgi:Cof subfamily protein (haloacid dehalogenase superfamily)